MKKKRKIDTTIDHNRCPAGLYWVRYKDKSMPRKPKIMEKQNGNTWWNMGWDIEERDMGRFEILGEVEPWKKKD